MPPREWTGQEAAALGEGSQERRPGRIAGGDGAGILQVALVPDGPAGRESTLEVSRRP
jgi:hypothetical protein